MFKNKLAIIICAAVAAMGIGAAAGVISSKKDVTASADPEAVMQSGESAVQTEQESERDLFDFLTAVDPDETEPESVAESTTKKENFWQRLTEEAKPSSTKAEEAAESTQPSEKTSVTKAPTTGTTVQKTTAKKTTAATKPLKPGAIPNYKYAYAGFEPCYAKTDADWNLLLVNRNYILPDDYVPTLADAVTDGNSNGQKLDYRVAPYYNKMYAAAKKDGIILTPVSGYRSLTRQRNNFENKIDYYINQGYSKVEATQMAAKRILPPGTSEHNAGMAMDIVTADSTAGFQYTKEYKWLDENAADFGFILRYPENKQSITEIIYEPWHWRYVGVEAAKAMKSSGMCLEEYLGV